MKRTWKLALSTLVLAACTDSATSPAARGTPDAPTSVSAAASEISGWMDATNASLAASDAPYRVMMAEYITADGSDEAGQTLLQKDVGNKQLSADFVANDARRGWSGPAGTTDNITYAIDATGDALPTGGLVTATEATDAIQRGMATWDNASCSNLALTENGTFGIDVGYVAYLLSGGAIGSPFVFADVQHAGWRDLNFAGGVLGVTYTFVFTSGGAATDVDGNGKADVAFREIYYDPSWAWGNTGGIDIESVALHEAGHGLSQAHFGNIVRRNDGSFDANPRAVMNAFYQSAYRSLAGTDLGGHCSNWAAWPNR
jgi:hypothetical protein